MKRRSSLRSGSTSSGRLPSFFLVISTFVALVSIFGFKFFTLNSGMLVEYPWAMELYPYSFKVFAQTQILLSFMVVVSLLWQSLHWKWLPSFLCVYLVSLTSEFMGTSWGIPFGRYEYTDLLGYKLFERVPWLIPCSWFFMSVASYRLSQIILGDFREMPSRFMVGLRCLLATLVLVLWDVTLDPAMSHTTPFWLWEQKGNYYGMPALNIFGWVVTGFAIMLILEYFLGAQKIRRLSAPLCIGLYCSNLFLPLGILAAVGAWLPLILTLLIGAGLWIAGRWAGTRYAPQGLTSMRLERSAP